MAIMDDETLQMYVEESKEHLETIESDLLEIEQGGEAIDEGLVNKVFRAAHSIKGGASFLGLLNIKELSHKIENILDMVRNFELVPNSDIINTLLKSFDYLGVLFDDVLNSNEMEIEEYTTSLKSIVSGSVKAEEKSDIHQETEVEISENGPSFKVSQFDMLQARKGGKNIYILEVDLIHDVQRKDETPMNFISGLVDIGTLIDTCIGISMVGDLDDDEIISSVPMYILLATVVEPELLSNLLGIEKEKITLVPQEQDSSLETIELNSKTSQQEQEETEETEEVLPAPQVAENIQKTESSQEEKISEEPVKPKTKAPKPSPKKNTDVPPKAPQKLESLRVPVSVLDQLMNRAGELVLARNELQLAITEGNNSNIVKAGQRVDQVTSELQESIMLTRMQPVGAIFNKFTRVVRDMSRNLQKKMSLYISGSEVELDKSIIEGLADPLTHLVRNSCDHGIEQPEERIKKGKPEEGQIHLRALHESGQVIIEIEDDGKGLDPEKLTQKAINKGLISEEQASAMSDAEKTNLIMLPGFSTAEQITDVSGRGVGMDVVKTNLDLLGGQIELKSTVNIGTIIRIKLPLTLAIMPSLLVEVSNERYALPQVNVAELIRIPAAEVRDHIDKVGGADVLVLRGEMIPLLQLNNVLNLTSTFYDRKTGTFRPDRRKSLSDQRLLADQYADISEDIPEEEDDNPERRQHRASDISIVVMQAGHIRFGLVVEKVHDTIEIVVKPLGRHLSTCDVYAGATIMGDGHVALILDVAGLGKRANLRELADRKAQAPPQKIIEEHGEETIQETLLLFRNGPSEVCAIPLNQVVRLEEIQSEEIAIKGGKKVVQYRGKSLPLFALEEVATVDMLEERKKLNVIIFNVAGREVGLLATPPLDVIDHKFMLDETTLRQPGISGSTIINNETTLMVNISEFMKILNPEWFEADPVYEEKSEPKKTTSTKSVNNILLAEDSTFFRNQVKQLIEDRGFTVFAFEDGQQAWDYLNENPEEINLIVTDLEMPNMDGFELTQNIKQDNRFSGLNVIALTSLASEEDMLKGGKVGIDNYQIKLDKEKLLQQISDYLS